MRIMTLDLRAPFHYRETESQDPFTSNNEGESIACFELMDSDSIEVDREKYLGLLSFSGETVNSSDVLAPNEGTELIVDAGLYLFAQCRLTMDRETFIDMAIELQKEGLWRRYQLNSRVYLRVLSEEEGPVFQVLRPFTERDE